MRNRFEGACAYGFPGRALNPLSAVGFARGPSLRLSQMPAAIRGSGAQRIKRPTRNTDAFGRAWIRSPFGCVEFDSANSSWKTQITEGNEDNKEGHARRLHGLIEPKPAHPNGESIKALDSAVSSSSFVVVRSILSGVNVGLTGITGMEGMSDENAERLKAETLKLGCGRENAEMLKS